MLSYDHGCDYYDRVRLLYRKISDPNSNNRTIDVDLMSNPRNWTDIENVNDNDRYELTLIVFNNEDLKAETMKYMFPVGRGTVRHKG